MIETASPNTNFTDITNRLEDLLDRLEDREEPASESSLPRMRFLSDDLHREGDLFAMPSFEITT